MKKLFSFIATFLLLTMVFVSSVSAHVAVTPGEVKTAVRQDFSVGVPNEKEIPTTEVRLILPDGLESVTPYVKAGWIIEMKTSGEGEEAKVTEITWKDGSIGQGLRDSFEFRAMTPSDATTLTWKAYQTYSDGTVVSWDQESEGGHGEEENIGPASKTNVVNELTNATETKNISLDKTTTYISYAALLVGVIALALSLRKKST